METEQLTPITKEPIIERPWRTLWKRFEKEGLWPKEPDFSKTLDQLQAEFLVRLQERHS